MRKEVYDMKVLEIIMPVLVMILLGIWCRKKNVLTQSGIDNIKSLVTNIMLPVAIFHALATAEYTGKIGILVGIMFVMLLISFSVGFLLKPLLEAPYKKYLPYMVCVYEGGMISQIAVLDIAGLLFGFSVYMGMLGQTENGGKISAKALFFSAVKTPAFVASVLGIAAGLTGIISRLVESSFGGVYLSVENILTTSVTSMILLVVGYSMELTRELISPCIKTIILRICVQAVMMAGVLLAVHFLVGSSQLMDLAIILYMSAPATFSMQTFLKKKESSAYVSTTNSLYCIVSILVYMVLALIIY